jgi:hypothetical protein
LPSTLDSATFAARNNEGILQREMAEADPSLQRLERRIEVATKRRLDEDPDRGFTA